MHSIDKRHCAINGDDTGSQLPTKPCDPTAHEIRLLVSGLPDTEAEARHAINVILDRLDPNADMGDQLARYTHELTPSEEREFFTMARGLVRRRAGFDR